MDYTSNYENALELLMELISVPSVSRDEELAADLVLHHLINHGYMAQRIGNNVICRSHHWDDSRRTLLLNSHIDTVKPVNGWTRHPYSPVIEDGRLYGLGSNDAGAGLVSLLQTFFLLDAAEQSYNILFVASCEEEVSGEGGMKKILEELPDIDVALIGEPTGMQPAVAERGLMVLDLEVYGLAGHAARNEGINSIIRAIRIISLVKEFCDDLQDSDILGPVKMTPTIINAGTQHNVIPDVCTLTFDVRSNDMYTNRELFDALQAKMPEWCHMKARSFCLNSSSIATDHPLIRRAVGMGLVPFGSPTLSDQSLLSCPSFKMGPGDSARSHTADEYIRLEELSTAIPQYYTLLNGATL
jgi:acetylornithine deacetylase